MYLPACRTPYTLHALLFLRVLSRCRGSPIPEAVVDARQAFDCYNPKTTFDESCWATLNLTAYLNGPVTGWNHTLPVCEGKDLDSTCCLTTEPWTTCYLRLAHGNSGRDCSQINAQMCSYDPDINVDPRIAPYVAYTVKNIYDTCQSVSQNVTMADFIQPSTISLRPGTTHSNTPLRKPFPSYKP